MRQNRRIVPHSGRVEEFLPQHLRIPNSGQHLYRIGFSLYNNDFTERKAIYHPILVFVIPSIVVLRLGFSTITPTDYMSHRSHLLIGDFGYLIGLKSHLNATAFLVFLVPVLSHAFSIINYLRGKPESYLAVFDMMCGRISPASVGLTNTRTITTIVSKSRLAFKLNDFTRFSMLYLGSSCCFFAFVYAVSWLDMILIGQFYVLPDFFYDLQRSI